MKGNRNTGWRQAAGAFALGATAGSAAALLFAPASGRATRKRLVSKLQQGQKLLAKKAGYLKDAAVERIGDTREWLVEHVPNGRHPAHRATRHS